MRTAYLETITDLMKKHEEIIVITSDMGFSVFENMQVNYPDRFINTGVTEQSSISIAAGFALSGHTVYFYAQAPFATMRCFEQVRLDVASHNANVKIIGAASGFYSNQLGVSHFALEDISLMRTLPNMTVFVPGDPYEAKWATEKSYEVQGPVYVRLTKSGSENVHNKELTLPVGESITLYEGSDISIFISGSLLPKAQQLHSLLEKKGVSSSIISFPTIKPIDKATILAEARKSRYIFTIEDHFIVGGLGSTVAEILAEEATPTRLVRIGVPDQFTKVAGSLDYLLDYNGLSLNKMLDTILTKIGSSV